MNIEHVHCMPKTLNSGVLYVSLEFETAAHLCACGCGQKIRTPLAPTEWRLAEGNNGPSLYPSIGNWQQACRSHYIIRNGKILWCDAWSEEMIADGRADEQRARHLHYKVMYKNTGALSKIKKWVKSILKSNKKR